MVRPRSRHGRRARTIGAGEQRPCPAARRALPTPGRRSAAPGGARPHSGGTARPGPARQDSALSMTEEVPAAPTMPACNGSVLPEHGPLQPIGASDGTARSAGTVPRANAETSPHAPPAKEKLEENRNSLAENITPGDFAAEKRCQEKREEKDGTLQQGPADIQDTGTDGQGAGAAPGDTEGLAESTAEPGTAASPSQEEEEEDVEEEDTEEDEVQVIEIKKENSEVSHLQQRDSSKEPPAPASPGCNSPLEKPGEQPSLGKKNDISRHSYSRYNTISYRRIRKGNTKQRIDEFESMMHL